MGLVFNSDLFFFRVLHVIFVIFVFKVVLCYNCHNCLYFGLFSLFLVDMCSSCLVLLVRFSLLVSAVCFRVVSLVLNVDVFFVYFMLGFEFVVCF